MNGASGSFYSSVYNINLQGNLVLTVNWTQIYDPDTSYSTVHIEADLTRENSGNNANGTWFAASTGGILVNGTQACGWYQDQGTGWNAPGSTGWTGSGDVVVEHTDETTIQIQIQSIRWYVPKTETADYSGSSFTIPEKTVDVTLYAVPHTYALSINAATGSWLTVNRIDSPRGGASNENLSDGSIIYDEDVLQISGGANEGYDFNGLVVNDSSFTSGGTYTVSGDVSVSALVSAKRYVLYIDQCDGTSLLVYRSSSPNGGAAAGYLSNNAVIYHGDILTIYGEANAGYNFNGLTVNGVAFSSGGTITVTGDISAATTASLISYTLTINRTTGTNLSVYRSSSPKAGASVGYLDSGATIYYGDLLQINGSAQTGYDFNGIIVNDKNFTSGETYTVTGDTSVSATTSIQQFTLTINQGAETVIVVNRTASPNKGAGTGNLENNAAVYYGDVLQITASSSIGWEIATLTVNNVDFTGGKTITVSSNIIIVSEAKQQGLVYIGEDGVFSAYQVYIYNGVEWDMYVPYIKDGVDWVLQS